jgi:hypothetical protein
MLGNALPSAAASIDNEWHYRLCPVVQASAVEKLRMVREFVDGADVEDPG